MQSSYTEYWSGGLFLTSSRLFLTTEIPELLSFTPEHRDPEFNVSADALQHLVKCELTEETKERQGIPHTAHNASTRPVSSGMLRYVVW